MKLDLFKFAGSTITSTSTIYTGAGVLGGENAGSVGDGQGSSYYIPAADTGSAKVEYDLERVNAAYKALAHLEKESEANAAKLSDLSLMKGVDDDGNYSKALKCIKGVNGLPGNTGSALDRARSVRRALLEAQGISEELFDDLDNPSTDDFGADLDPAGENPDGSLPGYNRDGSPKNQQTGPTATESGGQIPGYDKNGTPNEAQQASTPASEANGTNPSFNGNPTPSTSQESGPSASETHGTSPSYSGNGNPSAQQPVGPTASESNGSAPSFNGNPSPSTPQQPGPSAEESHPTA